MSCDLTHFFLATPRHKSEYMMINYKYAPNDIREEYNLNKKLTDDGYIYVNQEMHIRTQAGRHFSILQFSKHPIIMWLQTSCQYYWSMKS